MSTLTATIVVSTKYRAGEIYLFGSKAHPEHRLAYEVVNLGPLDNRGNAAADLRRVPCATCTSSSASHLAGRVWVCDACHVRSGQTGSPWTRSAK